MGPDTMKSNAMKYAELSYPTGADGEYLVAPRSNEPKTCTCALHMKLMERQPESEHAEFQRRFHGYVPRHPRAG